MADTLDVLTLVEAKAGINFTGTTEHDTELARFITAVSRRLDQLCGPIVVRTVTDEPHSGGHSTVFFDKHPVLTVTTVKEYAGTTLTTLTAETVSSQIADMFQFDRRLGVLYRRSGGGDSVFTWGRGNVLVTYQAGRYADTAAVDPMFKTATAIILQELWRPSAGRWSNPAEAEAAIGVMPWAAFPKPARDLLGDELRPPGLA